MDEQFLYVAMNIYDRFRDEVLKKFPTYSAAAKKAGMSGTVLYQEYRLYTIKTLHKACKALDIDFEYCISGKNNSGHFSGKDISFSNLFKVAEEEKGKPYLYRIPQPMPVRAVLSSIRTGKRKNMSLRTLLYLSNHFKKSPLYLISEGE